MLHGVSGARFSYFTFPRLGSYFLMPCQLWHVQQYSLVAFVSVIDRSFRMYSSNIRAKNENAGKHLVFRPLAVHILIARSEINLPLKSAEYAEGK